MPLRPPNESDIMSELPAVVTPAALDAVDPEALTAVWNAACGEALSISPRAMAYNLAPSTDVAQHLIVASGDDGLAGFILVSKMANPHVMPAHVGWCDALAVTPAHQRRGIGSALLDRGEAWLRDQGCTHSLLGGSIRPFVPGLPEELDNAAFFRARGFFPRPDDDGVWDVAANLSDYVSPPQVREVDGQVRAATRDDIEPLRAFLTREFPGRWRYEFEEFLRTRARISDFMVLWTGDGVDGFCQLTFEDSSRPLDRFFPYTLPRPWGQLGPIGVSAGKRGQGLGAAVLDAGLRRLHNNGINGCVIDWTDLVEFYGKFGFTPYRKYVQLVKAL